MKSLRCRLDRHDTEVQIIERKPEPGVSAMIGNLAWETCKRCGLERWRPYGSWWYRHVTYHVYVKFEPRDIWIGVYLDRSVRRAYICLVPCFPIVVTL